MMATMKATFSNTTEGDRSMMFVAFASDLGFPVGRCPKVVETDLGNKQAFRLTRIERDADGDAVFAEFRQMLGCLTLRVFNT